MHKLCSTTKGSSPRDFAQASMPQYFTVDALLRDLHVDPYAFLEKLQVPTEAHHHLTQFVQRQGPLRAIAQLGIAECLGLAPRWIDQYFDVGRDHLGIEHLRKLARLPVQKIFAEKNSSDDRQFVFPFNATCRILPMAYVSPTASFEDPPNNQFVVVVEIDPSIQRALERIADKHENSSSASEEKLTIYAVGDLTDGNDQRVLLPNAAAALFFSVATDRTLQINKFISHIDRFDAEANPEYAPYKQLDTVSLHALKLVFSANGSDQLLVDRDGNPINLLNTLAAISEKMSPADQWIRTYNTFFEPWEERNCLGRGILLTSTPLQHATEQQAAIPFDSAAAGLESTPQGVIPFDALPGASEQLVQLHSEIINQPHLEPIRRSCLNDFTWLSRGRENGVVSRWWEIPRPTSADWTVKMEHIGGQDRHPSVRFIQRQVQPGASPLLCVGIKGGGLRALHDRSPIYPTQGLDEYRFPIYARRFLPMEPHMQSHKMWGGLQFLDGHIELIHTLGLHLLINDIGLRGQIEVPIPVDFGKLLTIPAWKNGRTEWFDIGTYSRRVLDVSFKEANTLGTYRSIYSSDVRLSQLVNRVFSGDEIGEVDLTQRIVDTLRFLYWNHTEQFIEPKISLLPVNGQLGMNELLEFLQSIYEANHDAAQRIYRRIVTNSLSLMGAVHGAHGHLGGTRLNGRYGALSGGSTALRNIDLRGGLHDFDTEVYFPWVERQDLGRNDRINMRVQTPVFQHIDKLHWRHSMYWVRKVLFGERCSNGSSVHEQRLGPYDGFFTFEDRLEGYNETLAFLAGETPTAPEVLSEHDKALYCRSNCKAEVWSKENERSTRIP